MMLATASTALIGLAIAAMLTAVSYGTQESKDVRSLVVKAKSVSTRLSAAIRQGSIVLAANTADEAGADWIILWTPGSEAEASAPKLSELHRIEYNAVARTIRSYRNSQPATDVNYALTDNFAAVTTAMIANGTLQLEVWATDVDDVQFRLDAAQVQDARLVSYRVVLRAGDITESAISAAALRNRGIATGP
jgi:hypothetical protein